MIGHVVPEAAQNGPIALVRDGDIVSFDMTKRVLELEVDDATLAARLASQPPPPVRCNPRSWLGRYSKQVTDASQGAVLK